MTVLAALAVLGWLYLLLLHGKFWQAGPVLAAVRPARTPAVDIVVPARDEADVIARALGSLLAQDYAGEFRVILVDDGSADGTGDVARALGSARLTVIEGAARPAGWAGKLWAVHQGVAAGSAPCVLLTDADIVHEPAHLSALLAQAERGGAALVSEMVGLACETLAERWLVPAFVYFFQLLYPFARVNNGRSRVAAAAGGTVLVRRDALERIGGIAAIRGALIDDVTLARAVKRSGERIWLGHSALARSVRPYPRFMDIWRMIARSAYVQLRFSPFLLLGTLVGLAVLFWVPVAALAWHGAARWLGAFAWIVMAGTFLPTLRRFRLSPWRAVALPAMATFYMVATLGSAIDHHRGRGVVWKRRAYAEHET